MLRVFSAGPDGRPRYGASGVLDLPHGGVAIVPALIPERRPVALAGPRRHHRGSISCGSGGGLVDRRCPPAAVVRRVRVEDSFDWGRTEGPLRQVKFRGVVGVNYLCLFTYQAM